MNCTKCVVSFFLCHIGFIMSPLPDILNPFNFAPVALPQSYRIFRYSPCRLSRTFIHPLWIIFSSAHHWNSLPHNQILYLFTAKIVFANYLLSKTIFLSWISVNFDISSRSYLCCYTHSAVFSVRVHLSTDSDEVNVVFRRTRTRKTLYLTIPLGTNDARTSKFTQTISKFIFICIDIIWSTKAELVGTSLFILEIFVLTNFCWC